MEKVEHLGLLIKLELFLGLFTATILLTKSAVWVDDGWVEGLKAVLRTAYSNQKQICF